MFKSKCLSYIACIACLSFQSFAQEYNAEIIANLNKVIQPIQSLSGDTTFTDISFLKEKLKNKEIIALGEVTHGSAEVFNYKDRLVRFLVSHMGYKAIAFESDYFAMAYMDDYICGKADSITYVAGTAIMRSNPSMIEWLRQYNTGKPEGHKVHIYGLESRNYTNIFKQLLAQIPMLDKTDRGLMEAYLSKPFGSPLSKQDKKDFRSMIVKSELKPLSDINKHYLNMLSQLLSYEDGRSVRDKYMAVNAMWLKERTKGEKLIVWAHNGHVAKMELYGYPTLGTHLDKKYGSKYTVIGTDFNAGKAWVNVFVAKNKPLEGFQSFYFPPVRSADWYEYFFAQCRFKNFILDTEETGKEKLLNQFLIRPRNMRSIGALSSPEGKKLSIARNFDFIVYLDETTSI